MARARVKRNDFDLQRGTKKRCIAKKWRLQRRPHTVIYSMQPGKIWGVHTGCIRIASGGKVATSAQHNDILPLRKKSQKKCREIRQLWVRLIEWSILNTENRVIPRARWFYSSWYDVVFMSSTYIVDDPQVHNLYGRPFARVLCIGTCTWYCSHALPTRMTKMPCLSNFTQVRKTRERLSVRRTIFRLSALSFATGEILRASVLTYQYTRYCICLLYTSPSPRD